MSDREKVRNGLRCLSGYNEMVENPCAGCGYNDCQTYAICVAQVARDALELLGTTKAGRCPARLMTKEEVLSQPEGAVVWRECHLSNGKYELRPMVCDGKGHCGDFGLSAECKYDFSYRYYVRYWTNKPTDEQRQAVKWDE